MSREDWKETTLGEVATFTIGRTPARKNPGYWTRDLTYPFLTIKGMGSGEFEEGVTDLAIADKQAKSAPEGALLLSFKLSVGRVITAPRTVYFNEAIAWIQPDEDIVSQEFLALALENVDWTYQGNLAIKGKTLNSKSLKLVEIPLPPIEEQCEIVSFMQALDQMIQAGDREISSSEQMREDVLKTLLTNENDKWAEKPLMDVVNLQNGYAFKPKDLGNTGKPVVRIKQLFDPTATVDHSDIDIPEKFWITTGDIIFTWSARIDVAIWDRGDAYLNQHLFKVTTKDESVLSQDFTYMVIAEMIPRLTSHGTTMKHVTKTELNRQLVYIPPLEEQEKIVEKMQTLDSYLDSAKRSQEALKQVRKDVLHALLSGDKDVREVAEMFTTDHAVA